MNPSTLQLWMKGRKKEMIYHSVCLILICCFVSILQILECKFYTIGLLSMYVHLCYCAPATGCNRVLPCARGPESDYRAYWRYRTNHLLMDKWRFKATGQFDIFFNHSDNYTNLSYELAWLSMVPGWVNMLSYHIWQFISCWTNWESRLRKILSFVQSVE